MSEKLSGFMAMSATRNLNCPTHGEYVASVVILGGREIPGRCPECTTVLEAAEAEHNRARAVGTLLSRADIPLRYMDRSFENYSATSPDQIKVLATCQAYVARFEQRLRHGGGLILCGRPGTGKTHLMCAIAKAVAGLGRTAWYTTVAAAVRHVKQTFAPDSRSTEAAAMARFYWPELLVLDEVGMQRGTEFELVLLAEVMNERYSRVRPTILATNLTLAELGRYIGERALDRMREGGGVVLALDWESYRGRVEDDPALSWPAINPVDFAELANQ
jgi:DNA replication protein DnaC